MLENDTVVQAMERALDEGREMDENLTTLAEEELNPAMAEGAGEEEEQPRKRRSSR